MEGNELRQLIQEIQQMRANNNTGGAVGNVSDIEYMRNNNNTGGSVGNVSDTELQYFQAMQEQDRMSQINALREKGASGMGLLSDAEVSRYQQLQRGIGNVSDRENMSLQQLINIIQQKRNPYIDPYADAPGPTNEDLSRTQQNFLRQQEQTNSMENYYNNLRNYQVNPQYDLDKIL